MDRYAGIVKNDMVNGEGVCVSFFTQGCPHHCKGCHNPETWDFNGGEIVPTDIIGQLIKAICANGITRNFSVLGGEPLCVENLKLVNQIVTDIRVAFPHIKIFLWTGYTLEELKSQHNHLIKNILSKINVLIDGRYNENLKDTTLHLRGSSNQRVLLKGVDF